MGVRPASAATPDNATPDKQQPMAILRHEAEEPSGSPAEPAVDAVAPLERALARHTRTSMIAPCVLSDEQSTA
jgi:hypothetical protein